MPDIVLGREYCALQDKWIKNIGGIKAGDEFLVVQLPTADQWPYAIDPAWGGKVGNISKDVARQLQMRPQGGILLHRYGQYQVFPFFCLVKL